MKAVGLAALAALLGAAGQDKKGLEIYWVDVEGGAATLIVTPEGESLLVDNGWPKTPRDPERLRDAAKLSGVTKIDHFLCTHFDIDHWGGTELQMAILPIQRFYDPDFAQRKTVGVDPKLKEAYLKAAEGKRTVVKPGDTIPLKGADVRVLCANEAVLGEAPGAPQIRPCGEHPPAKEDLSENSRSAGILVEFKGFKFLDLGDLTHNVEHKLVCPKNLIGKVDAYQVTHHGLDISNHPALLKAADPTVAVMNNGARKGGSKAVYPWFKEVASLKDVFQLHKNMAAGAENVPAELIANEEAPCKGHFVKLTVDPSGKSYLVEIPAKGVKREYKTR